MRCGTAAYYLITADSLVADVKKVMLALRELGLESDVSIKRGVTSPVSLQTEHDAWNPAGKVGCGLWTHAGIDSQACTILSIIMVRSLL